MSANLTTNPALIGTGLVPDRSGLRRLFDPAYLGKYRQSVVGYCQVLAGAGGRLVLQVVYFFVLANTLSLAEMGVFASVSAAGVMIGCFAGLGFQSFVFRSAAGRRTSMGGYLGAYYVGFALSLPLMMLVAGLLYIALFRHAITLPGYCAIVVVEVVFWRLVELLVQMNNGLGRYSAAATVVALSAAFRSAAAVAFWAHGGGDAETWATYYLVGNGAAVLILGLVYHPRVRVRFREALLARRFRDGLLFAFSTFVFNAQSEVDKILVLSLAGERMAGIYAIAMRVIDLTAVPLRPFFVMYSRKLIQAGRASAALVRECLRVELMVAVVSMACVAAVLVLLSVRPGILGANVSTALGMLWLLAVVPAFRNMLEFHSELFFAFDKLKLRALVATAIVLLKGAGLAVLLLAMAGSESWGGGLSAIYAAVYALSFAVVYGFVAKVSP